MHTIEARGSVPGVLGGKIVTGTRAERIAWIVLNVVPAHFGIPLLVGTILLSKKVRRLPVFVNMCIVWILNGIWSCLLVYSGHNSGPEPPKGLCLAQAALLNGIFPAASLAAFFLVLQLFLSLKSALRKDASQSISPICNWIMLITPHIAIVIAVVATIKVGINNPGLISRREAFFYCTVHSHALFTALLLFSSSVLVVTLFFEAWTLVILFPHMRLLRAGVLLDQAFIIRVAVFTVYIVLGLCLGIIVTILGCSVALDILVPTLSWALCFIFGSQRDFLTAWAFWRRKEVASEARQ